MTNHLLDNDVVVKFAQYNLFGELEQLCGGMDNMFILPTLRFRFHLRNEAKALGILKSATALSRIREFVGAVEEIGYADEALIEAIQDVPQVDAGEAVLFAAALADDLSLTLTGDKRAIESLFRSEIVREAVAPLVGRIKCVEQIVAELLIAFDESSLIDRIKGEMWDTSLRACFSSGDTASILEGLYSYYSDLNAKCANALAPFPGPT